MPTPSFELACMGSPWHHDVPRFVRMAAPRRRGVPQPLQQPLWEKLAPIRQRACGEFWSPFLRWGALGGFERRRRGRFPTIPRKTRFARPFFLTGRFDLKALVREAAVRFATVCNSCSSYTSARAKPAQLDGTTTLPGLPRARRRGAGALGPRQRRRRRAVPGRGARGGGPRPY